MPAATILTAAPAARTTTPTVKTSPPTTRGPDHVGAAKSTTTRRRFGISLFTVSTAFTLPTQTEPAAAAAGGKPVDMRALIRAFDDAMAAGADFEAADEAWTRAIGEEQRKTKRADHRCRAVFHFFCFTRVFAFDGGGGVFWGVGGSTPTDSRGA